MTNSYEMMYIVRTGLPEEQTQQEIAKYENMLKDLGAENLKVQILGKRRLAYPIKKQNDGIYVQVNYQADGKQVVPVEKAMRLSDEILRYLTIKLKKQPSEEIGDVEAETVQEVEVRKVEVPIPVASEVLDDIPPATEE